MVLRYSLHYLIARGIPALVNFLAIAVYTRLLSPDAYGRYILVLAGVNIANLTVFQWLRLSLVRYLPAYQEQEGVLLGTIGRIYLILMAGVGVLGGVAGLIVGGEWRSLVLVAVLLLWMQAWFELNVELLRARLQTRAYGWAMGVRSVGALALGTLFILGGLGAFGPLLGLVLSMAVVGLGFAYRHWRTVKLQLDRERLRPLLRYGLPLAGTLILSYIVSVSDRFLIAWLLDEAQAGIYAAGYDLANQPVILLMSIVNLAAYPLIVQVWEHEGEASAQAYLVRNLRLLLIVGVPATVGLAMLARPFGELVLGASFHSASAVVPLIALGTLLDGLRVYHTDLAFHLGQRTTRQLQIVLWVFLINLGLNLLWIPHMGIRGAAWATVVAYGMALILSIWQGRNIQAVPLGFQELLRTGGAGIGMGLGLWILTPWIGWVGAGIVGLVVYGLLLWALYARPKIMI
ncbi:oligosaccharide flippase family protein [Rhodothermus marinus]|uniref:oligosaccharide flippase family protein n=1 Tax=Rhodothermus marinus TaxID=29549 RepID=UPI0012BA53FC|nr:oligosaccharide flippase family protein [Rhodothermus marinus]BBM69008.1 membrane protein [Rhodothermus marinus]